VLMGTPTGFTYRARIDGSVAITHQGKAAGILRGSKASKFLAEASSTDSTGLQQTMARLTGNYKHGNEKCALEHSGNEAG
jgi:hypothetical protein